VSSPKERLQARLAIDYGMNPVMYAAPIPPDLDDQGERQRIARSLSIYARQYHIAAMEGEVLSDWLARVERRREGMTGMQRTQMAPFLALLKVFAAAAMGIAQDELDELITRKNAPQTKPAQPSIANPTPGRIVGAFPSNVSKACTGPCCTPPHSTTTPQVDPTPINRSALKDVDLGPLLGRQRHSASPKDSILNPPVKGFVGSDKYGYDPDVD
jgi:hypothetical protein